MVDIAETTWNYSQQIHHFNLLYICGLPYIVAGYESNLNVQLQFYKSLVLVIVQLKV